MAERASANPLNDSIREQASLRFNGHVVLWRNNVLKAMVQGRNGKPRMMQAGMEGQADLSGIMPDGRRLEVETKTPRDKMSDKQIAFRRMIMSRGGVYIIARDLETCMAELAAEVKRGEV